MASNNIYDRSSVPFGEKIILSAQFKDSAGNPKDPDNDPRVQILDAATAVARSQSATGVFRVACGLYQQGQQIMEQVCLVTH